MGGVKRFHVVDELHLQPGVCCMRLSLSMRLGLYEMRMRDVYTLSRSSAASSATAFSTRTSFCMYDSPSFVSCMVPSCSISADSRLGSPIITCASHPHKIAQMIPLHLCSKIRRERALLTFLLTCVFAFSGALHVFPQALDFSGGQCRRRPCHELDRPQSKLTP